MATDARSSAVTGLTWRALLLGCGLTALFGLWVRQAEIVFMATQISESVPAIPAIAALALLMVLNPLLARLGVRRRPRTFPRRCSAARYWRAGAATPSAGDSPLGDSPSAPASAPQGHFARRSWATRPAKAGWRLSKVEVLSVYCFVAIAISLAGCGIIRFQLALLGHLFYFARPENGFARLQQHLPGWLAPKQPGVMSQMYEGAPDGRVPWGAWAVPLLAWGGFFLVMWVGMLCMMVLVRRRWMDEERLTYPIAQLPLDIVQVREPAPGQPPFLRDRVMWMGFAVAFAYNGINMAHALWPIIPTIGNSLDLRPLMTQRPWQDMLASPFYYRPELVGFGYLVPADIAFSIWFFFVLSLVEALVLRTGGFDVSGAPFEQEQSIGAFLLLGALLIWGVRRHLAGAARELVGGGPSTGSGPPLSGLGGPSRPVLSAVEGAESRGGEPPTRRPPPEPAEALPRRWALLGVIGAFVALCAFCRVAGMQPWVAAAYLGIVMVVALASARIRAEAGVPLIWLFPFYQQKKVLLYLLGPAAFVSGALPGTLTLFALLAFLSRGYFPALIGYQAESLKIARQAGMNPRHMAILMILALVVGLAVAYNAHLVPYYRDGAQYLPRGYIWGATIADEEYRAAAAPATALQRRDPYRLAATTWGFLLAGALAHARRALLGFPLHPVGYAVATSYGILLGPSFFVVWLIKGSILRYGGLRLYRRTVPFFLGLALGHLFTAGVIWGLMGAYGGPSFGAYAVWFG